jgi:hypothetical protein
MKLLSWFGGAPRPPEPAGADSILRRLTGDAWTFDPLGALVRVPAVVGIVALGLASGRTVPAVIAASGAFLVGMGAPLALGGSHALLLSVATMLIAASAVVGSVAASYPYLPVIVVAGLGAICGLAARSSTAIAWIGLQCALAGVIATSYPASLARAADRALLIAAGGFAQTLVVALGERALRRTLPPAAVAGADPRYAAHLAVGLAAALPVDHLLGIRNSYWIPMTTLLVLRPTTRGTVTRAVARTVGTVAGVSLATAIVVAVGPDTGWLVSLLAGAVFAAYAFQKATYGLLSACVGLYVIFLLSIAGSPAGALARARIEATLVGAALGILVQVADEAVARRGRRAAR